MKVKIIHGPNLNQLGERDREIYGHLSLEDINQLILKRADELGIKLDIFQSNHEGDIVDYIQQDYKDFAGIIINPAGLTHYSIVLRDALALTELPIIEVHLSNIYSREEFRAKSVVSPIADGVISGLGHHGYLYAVDGIYELIRGGVANEKQD